MQLWKSQTLLSNPLPEKKDVYFHWSFTRSLISPPSQDAQTATGKSTSQHRTQWSMLNSCCLSFSLTHTHTMTHRHIQTHNAYKSCRTEHSVPKEWFIVKLWKLPKQLQSGCSTKQWEMVKYVPLSRSLQRLLTFPPYSPFYCFQMNQLINSPQMAQDGRLGGGKKTPRIPLFRVLLTFINFADAFIQNDLQDSGYTFLSVCVPPGNCTHNLLCC